MLAAAMVQRDHTAIIRAPLVRAYAEQTVELALKRHEEATGGTQIAFGRLGAQRLWPTRTFVPALGSLCAAQRAQYMATGETKHLHCVIDILQG